MKRAIYTIGHSTHPIEHFIDMLKAHGVEQVVDIRTIPRSRHNPQFNKDNMPGQLRPAGIRYLHMPELGGLRKAKKDSVNVAWENASFRGFADYMQTEEFAEGIHKLIEISQEETTAIMCAEALPWRCHRSLIADALTVREVKVIHIFSATNSKEHALTPFACVKNKEITYPR
jgi:uncharacterized protein (DUF488 family)